MHRAWNISELVNTILEGTIHPISPPPPEFSREHESHLAPLAVLARTCRMFQDPALDLLWRSQKSLYPLLSCLPSDAWDLHENSEMKSTTRMRLLRPLTASDWSRVLVYSPRIKCLTLILGSQSRTYSFWVSIRTSIPGPFLLLPNLQRLSHTERIHHLQLPDPPVIQDFLGPRLTFLSLGAFSGDLVGLPDLIPLLPNPVGIKIKVRIQQPSSRPPDTEKISRFVSALNVTSLEVPELDSAAMRHISSSPSLRFLALSPYFTPSSSRLDLPSPAFPVLRELVLGRDQCASAAELMSVLKAQSWQLDSLEFACTPNLANFQDLRDHCSHPMLKRLHLSLGRNLYVPMATDTFDQADIARCRVPFNVVQVLFSFPNLAHLALTSAIGIDLDDATVLQMALA
ncbi:hypothetical protein C8R43DRAFT_1122244 [Mycena crocata]|nr:hypothetical protein C8R43DRAFT_1122244 [Mycena crocata]